MGEESVKIDRAALLRIAGRAVHGADSTITPEDAAAVLEAVGYRHYSESYDYETGEGGADLSEEEEQYCEGLNIWAAFGDYDFSDDPPKRGRPAYCTPADFWMYVDAAPEDIDHLQRFISYYWKKQRKQNQEKHGRLIAFLESAGMIPREFQTWPGWFDRVCDLDHSFPDPWKPRQVRRGYNGAICDPDKMKRAEEEAARTFPPKAMERLKRWRAEREQRRRSRQKE